VTFFAMADFRYSGPLS